MTYDLDEATRYLKTGGLGEVIGFADFARASASPKVQMDTDMGMALCLLATAGIFQANVGIWMQQCFGPEISADKLERGDRLLEKAFELLQSGDYPRERIRALENYVYARPVGEPAQEMGGVQVTLAAYGLAFGLDMHAAAEAELARCWAKIDTIRTKQAAKPTGSALPVVAPERQDEQPEYAAKLLRWLEDESCDLRCIDVPTGGDDADIDWIVVGHYQAEPRMRERARASSPMAAIEIAMKVDAYDCTDRFCPPETRRLAELERTNEFLRKRRGDLVIERDAATAALQKLVLAYVNLLELGRDRIIALGGQCDPVDVMEAGDPALRAAKAAVIAAGGSPEDKPLYVLGEAEK